MAIHGLVLKQPWWRLGIHHFKKPPYVPWSKQRGCFYKRGWPSAWSSLKHSHQFQISIILRHIHNMYPIYGAVRRLGDTQFGSFIIGKLMINSGMWSDHIWPRNQWYLVGRFDGIYTLLAMKPRETWWLTMLDFGVYTIFIYTICIHTRHIIYIYIYVCIIHIYIWYYIPTA